VVTRPERAGGAVIPMTVNYISGPKEQHEAGRWPSPPDPGDLSKRVARRRAELRLSVAQVAARVGRIAFTTGSGPVVLPVNFAVLDDTLVIRTAEGTIIDGHAGEQVAVEVDHLDEALCQGWSVLVRGPAHRVAHPAELRRLQEDAAVWP
jgi:Pyridoxamine 5'-phosphate oxidase